MSPYLFPGSSLDESGSVYGSEFESGAVFKYELVRNEVLILGQ